MPKALKSCPKSNKLPNLVTLGAISDAFYIFCEVGFIFEIDTTYLYNKWSFITHNKWRSTKWCQWTFYLVRKKEFQKGFLLTLYWKFDGGVTFDIRWWLGDALNKLVYWWCTFPRCIQPWGVHIERVCYKMKFYG